MSTLTTYLIVPGDRQCRIVTRDGESHVRYSLRDYRDNPDNWKEVGLMNSQGKLVCLDASRQIWDDMKSCEPLSAGSIFTYEKTPAS